MVMDPKAVRVGETFNPIKSIISITGSVPNALFFNYSKRVQDKIDEKTFIFA
jgi:hypothetical protein